MRGFAVFWILALAWASLSWLGAWAAHVVVVDDVQIALAELSHKRIIDQDVRRVLVQSLVSAQGADVEARVVDAAYRLEAAELFLERQYRGLCVDLDVFFGFVSEVEKEIWLDELGKNRKLQKCPRCLNVGFARRTAVLSVLSDSNGSVDLSRNGLYRGAFPFASYGVAVLGAVFSFGDVIGVAVV